MRIEELAIESCDVVSFDIFDTLLFRTYLKPSDLWRDIEIRLKRPGFAAQRIWADGEAYRMARAEGRDATLREAYALMGDFADLEKAECEFERQALVANDEMVRIWNEVGDLGKRRIIISDMYLPEEFLQEVLETRGIAGWRGFYVSNAWGARKSDGLLYDIVLKDQGVVAERVCHIGDNKESDVGIPLSKGIRAYHYNRWATMLQERRGFIRRVLRHRDASSASRFLGVLLCGWNNYLANDHEDTFWSYLGYFVGGALGLSFVQAIAQDVINTRLDTLCFVARDGWTLEKVFNFVLPQVPTQYVYAPRGVNESDDVSVRKEYADYVRGLNLHGKVGVVDTFSKKFTSQKLLSKYSRLNIRGYFLITTDRVANGISFVYAPNCSLKWLLLPELLFMAPTPSVKSVCKGEPIYNDIASPYEKNRIKVYPEVSAAIVASAKNMYFKGETPSLDLVLDIIDAFVETLSPDQTNRLDEVKAAVDVNHMNYVPVLNEGPKGWRWFKFLGIPYRRQHYYRENDYMRRVDYLFGFLKVRSRKEPF